METRRSSRFAVDALLGHWKRLTRRRLALAAVLVSALLLMTTVVVLTYAQGSPPRNSAAPQADPVGTAFTYQGQLKKDGNPVDGPCDFQFGLYDAENQGNQYRITQTMSITVTDGLFTASLDFGDVFTGTARWLEARVMCADLGDTEYADLGRQELTAAPYALYALSAPWEGLTGVPADFADEVDDTDDFVSWLEIAKLTGSGSTQVARGDHSHDFSPYENVVVVAKSGGDFASIQAALDSITATAASRYLVWVAPGTYTETVTMEEYVDIEGAGELLTRITYTGSGTDNTGTVVGADNAELRFLTVENTGGSPYAIAIYNNSASPRLTHVSASADGSLSYGVYNVNCSPGMRDVTASATGGGFSYGVYNNSASPEMRDVTASASASETSYGVLNTSSSPTMTNVTASGSGGVTDNYGVRNESSSPAMHGVIAHGSGGSVNCGVSNYLSSLTMIDVDASASGGMSSSGVCNHSSSPTIQNSVLIANSGSLRYGMRNEANTGTYTVTIHSCQITGASASIYSDSEFSTFVGGSLLGGGSVVTNSGTITCAGVYDENYAWSDDTCP